MDSWGGKKLEPQAQAGTYKEGLKLRSGLVASDLGGMTETRTFDLEAEHTAGAQVLRS